jgi:DNA gyrase subunit A
MATKEDDVVTTLFVANTHTPLCSSPPTAWSTSSRPGACRLAGARPSGKAIVNILPIAPGVSIAAIMPVDAPEETGTSLQIVFATSDGDVRRNALSTSPTSCATARSR